MLSSRPRTKRRFQLILIKPSHYDDDGYVIQWLYSAMPSNSGERAIPRPWDACARRCPCRKLTLGYIGGAVRPKLARPTSDRQSGRHGG
jgi:hypothetical protein